MPWEWSPAQWKLIIVVLLGCAGVLVLHVIHGLGSMPAVLGPHVQEKTRKDPY